MKKFSFTFPIILSVVFLVISCSNNDDLSLPSEDLFGVGALSFGIVPVSNPRDMESGFSINRQAECSNSQLKFVRVALKDSQGKCYTKNSDSGFFEMEIDPAGLDTNNDEIKDTWETSDDKKLLLPVGTYTVEYFAVTNKLDNNSEIILMSPRRGEEGNAMQYYNWVTNPLPLQFTIREGMEHYIPLEALCFKKDLAFEFGFVFLEYEDPNPFYICAQ
jgi:hypothetical protein